MRTGLAAWQPPEFPSAQGLGRGLCPLPGWPVLPSSPTSPLRAPPTSGHRSQVPADVSLCNRPGGAWLLDESPLTLVSACPAAPPPHSERRVCSPGIWLVLRLFSPVECSGSGTVPVSEPGLKGSLPGWLLSLSLEALGCWVRVRPPRWEGHWPAGPPGSPPTGTACLTAQTGACTRPPAPVAPAPAATARDTDRPPSPSS